MLSASNLLKRVSVHRWKTPKLSSSSFDLYNRCSYPSFDRGESDYSLTKLPVSVSHLLNNMQKCIITLKPIEVLWLCPQSSMLSTCIPKNRSFVTHASVEEEVANQVLDEIVSELKKGSSSTEELCTNHINNLCRNKNLRAAARLLQLLRDKHAINSLRAYNLLLAAACEEHSTELVLHIFNDMLANHLVMNSTTYYNVAKAISKSNDFTLVLTFVKEISNVTVINRIIYAFAECGHIHNAMLVFDNMKSLKCKPDLITYNVVLGILGKAGRIDEMLTVFASMKKIGIAPDIVSYNTLLNSLRKVGRFDLCVVLMKEMGKVGLQPDLRTYTALIECFFRSGNIEESLRLFEDMKHGHVRPSIYIYRSLISNLERLGKAELAIKFSVEMNECQEDLIGPKDFKRGNS